MKRTFFINQKEKELINKSEFNYIINKDVINESYEITLSNFCEKGEDNIECDNLLNFNRLEIVNNDEFNKIFNNEVKKESYEITLSNFCEKREDSKESNKLFEKYISNEIVNKYEDMLYESSPIKFSIISEKLENNIDRNNLLNFIDKKKNLSKEKNKEKKYKFLVTNNILKKKKHTKMNTDNIFVKIKSILFRNIVILINYLGDLGKNKYMKFNLIRYELSKKVNKEFNKILFKQKLKEILEYKSKKNKNIIELIEKNIDTQIYKKNKILIKQLLNIKLKVYAEILFDEHWKRKFVEKILLEYEFFNKLNNLQINLNVYESIKRKQKKQNNKIDNEYLNKVKKIMEKNLTLIT